MVVRSLFALPLLVFSSPAAWAACGPDPVPAPAQAAGLTCETFWDGPFNLNTIDTLGTATTANPNGSCVSGHCNWYTRRRWPNAATGSGCPGQSDVSAPGGVACTDPTPTAFYSIDGTGMLTINRTDLSQNSTRIDLSSCSPDTTPLGYFGFYFQAPFYLEWHTSGFGTGVDAGGSGGGGEATVWSVSLTYLVGGPRQLTGIELDHIEGPAGTHYNTWYTDGVDSQTEYFMTMNEQHGNNGGAFPQIATYGTLIIPKELNSFTSPNYTRGLSYSYVDNNAVSWDLTWAAGQQAAYHGVSPAATDCWYFSPSGPAGVACAGQQIPPQSATGGDPITALGGYTSMDQDQYCVWLGAGMNQPLKINWVRVWQLPSAGGPAPPSGSRPRWSGDVPRLRTAANEVPGAPPPDAGQKAAPIPSPNPERRRPPGSLRPSPVPAPQGQPKPPNTEPMKQ